MVTYVNRKGSTERDREATELRLLKAVEELGREKGFEQIGINAVAAYSGVSKILIYRYFGSVEGLLAAYIRRYDFWINLPLELPPPADLPACLKRLFREYVARMRSDITLKRLCRWELSSDNEIVCRLRDQRERRGRELIERIAQATGRTERRIAVPATFLTASVTYLAMLGERCPLYNGIEIGEEADWEPICREADRVIDRIFEDDTF